MLKMKRTFREDIDRSSRAVNHRIRSLFTSNSLIYSLEKMQEIAFTAENDEDGIPLMTIGMYEQIAVSKGMKDTRRKIIEYKNNNNGYSNQTSTVEEIQKNGEKENGGGGGMEEDDDINLGVYIRSNSMELLHIAFLVEDDLWQWKYYLDSHVQKQGLEAVTKEDFYMEN